MKRFIAIIIIWGLLLKVSGQCIDDKEIKFSGSAPSPWAIDGSVNDWQTIIGSFTGDNNDPYTPLFGKGFNWAKDMDVKSNNSDTDFDTPLPSSDIKFTAFIHDDYNVYFYLRRLTVSNSPNSVYYFCDINSDGFMNTGEPVFGFHLNGKSVSDLNVFSYLPNQNEDFVNNKGNWMISPFDHVMDGYSIKGTLEKVFGEHAIPSTYALNPHEIFDAAVTEDGYGIELSVPWSFLRNWKTLSAPLTSSYVFSFHSSLQKGAAPYRSQLVEDNAGNCCGFLRLSGNPNYHVGNKSIIANSDGLSYKLSFTVVNETSIAEDIKINQVALSDILLNDNLSFNPEDISIKVNGVSMVYFSGNYLDQPIKYFPPFLIGIAVTVQPFDSAKFTVDINLPSNHSISSLVAAVNISSSRFSGFIGVTYCFEETGGGKTINPVGFTIVTEEPARSKRIFEQEDMKSSHSMDIKVYPNPNRGSATLSLPASAGVFGIHIEDISGRTVQRWDNVHPGNFSIQNLKPGFYLLKVISVDTGKQIVKKIIVQ